MNIEQPNTWNATTATIAAIEERKENPKKIYVTIHFFANNERQGAALVELTKRQVAGMELDDESDRDAILRKALNTLNIVPTEV